MAKNQDSNQDSNQNNMDVSKMGSNSNIDKSSINQQPKGSDQADRGMAHKVGDAMEHAGDMLKQKGMDGLGGKLHEAGDKVEHMNQEK
jgi:hypothetical protein